MPIVRREAGKIKHFIFSSTAAVYGEPSVTPVDETVPLASINPYGRSKLYIQVSDLVAAHLMALAHLRRGGESLICNCGYGRGVSVFEVVDAVKQISGADFKVRISGRRPGDPASLVAGMKRIKAVLGWTPEYDDLPTIVGQALDWERRLHAKSLSGPAAANSLACDAV